MKATDTADFEERAWVRNNRLAGDPLAALIPSAAFEDNLIVNVDGSFAVGWKCHFPYLNTLSASALQQLFDLLKRTFNTLTNDYDVQVVFETNQRVRELEGRLDETANSDGLLADLAAEQKAALLAKFANGQLRWIDGFVVLVRKNPFPLHHFYRGGEQGLLGRLRHLMSSAPGEIAYTLEEWESLKRQFFEYADMLHSSLVESGALPRVLDPNGALELLYRYYDGAGYDRGGRPRTYAPAEEIPLTDHFLPAPCHWDESGLIKLGQRFLKVCVLRTPPEKVRFCQFSGLLLHGGLTKTKLVITFRRGDIEKRKKIIKDRIPELGVRAKKDLEFQNAYAEAQRELVELGSGTEKTWWLQSVFVPGGDTEAELERNVLTILKAAEQFDGIRVDVETKACVDFLIAAQPFWTRDKDDSRLLPFNTSQLVTQLPVCGQNGWLTLDNGKPARIGVLYESSAGSLVNFFPHEDRRFNNANVMVLGAAGSGKGMTINNLIAQMRMRHPARFVVIDIGGSYRKTSEALCPGGYFDMSLKQTGRVINPFFTADFRFPDGDELDAMVRFVEKILAGQDHERIPPELLGVIEQTIQQLFRAAQGKREVTLSDFRDLLQENPKAERIVPRLSRWCGQGTFANLFDGPNQLDTNNWLTVFDLTAIKDNKLVCPVMFGVIFSVVAQLAARFTKDLKFAIFDECADFLRDPIVAAYIETCYRQMRKMGVSVIGISQTLEEWLSTGSAAGFCGNTTHLVILRQDSNSAAELVQQTFNLSGDEFDIVRGLQSIPGEFSQALLWQRSGDGKATSNVVVQRPTPLGYAMGTTNPRDRAYFTQLREDKGFTYNQAIREFARQYPQGIARGLATNSL